MCLVKGKDEVSYFMVEAFRPRLARHETSIILFGIVTVTHAFAFPPFFHLYSPAFAECLFPRQICSVNGISHISYPAAGIWHLVASHYV